MSYIVIKNKKGTVEKLPPSGYTSWLDFWERQKGQRAYQCKTIPCDGPADVGGHVIKSGEGGKEYILPLCYECNNKPDDTSFYARESDLVSVQ
ncbi:MAG: hypothetical protein GX803_01630 [Lentisphaerae bacterium]|jgi:hypothetical protein|nr:hypothetical protein [Lentisphaerota bacterium]